MDKLWNVFVLRRSQFTFIGQVYESDESLARVAALSQFGVQAEAVEYGGIRARGICIYPDEEFSVYEAS